MAELDTLIRREKQWIDLLQTEIHLMNEQLNTNLTKLERVQIQKTIMEREAELETSNQYVIHWQKAYEEKADHDRHYLNRWRNEMAALVHEAKKVMQTWNDDPEVYANQDKRLLYQRVTELTARYDAKVFTEDQIKIEAFKALENLMAQVAAYSTMRPA